MWNSLVVLLLAVDPGGPAAAQVSERPANDAAKAGRPDVASIRIGMTSDEVRRLLGPPRQTAREFLYQRYLEQWFYDRPSCCVEFNCIRGQDPQVQTVHPSGTV